MDTSNILFIVGGAFEGLDKIVEARTAERAMGIGAKLGSRDDKRVGYLLSLTEPGDLIKFGMIPEFLGRLPVVATLNDLDEAALIQILTEPKNAIIKQYQKLFETEGVELVFEESALVATAQKALERKTGARGLRSILENAMLDTMYDIPSLPNCRTCTISGEVITSGAKPELSYETPASLEKSDAEKNSLAAKLKKKTESDGDKESA